jgi:hypothetical protein
MRLGEILKKRRQITAQTLEDALARQEASGERIGKILVDMGAVPPGDVMGALQEQLAERLREARAISPKLSSSRAAIRNLEIHFNGYLERMHNVDPVRRIGNVRGVYLDGFGVLFSLEVNLFRHPQAGLFTSSDREAVRIRKQSRLADLKDTMREMLLSAAASLTEIAANEWVSVAANLVYEPWEDTTALPSQAVMQAPREILLRHQLKSTQPWDGIRIQEVF